MSSPAVTFVVPCYKYAHYLPDCIGSVLSQTFQDWELLVLDDCSPDNTPEVVARFTDPRVAHVRQPVNLGAVANINSGIERARGKYVWVISADDLLARPDALGRMVRSLDEQPEAGFVFTRALCLTDGIVGEAKGGDSLPEVDTFLPREAIYRKQINGNLIVGPAAMARKKCYEAIGTWRNACPTLPDWHMWTRLALHYGAAYVAEPLTYYRVHQDSEIHTYQRTKQALLREHSMKIRWLLLQEAAAHGYEAARAATEQVLINEYAWRLAQHVAGDGARGMPAEELEKSLQEGTGDRRLADVIRHAAYRYAGNQLCGAGRHAEATGYYGAAWRACRSDFGTLALLLLLRTGAAGRFALRGLLGLRAGVKKMWQGAA